MREMAFSLDSRREHVACEELDRLSQPLDFDGLSGWRLGGRCRFRVYLAASIS